MKLSVRIEKFVESIYREIVDNRPGRGVAIDALSNLLWTEIYRWFKERATQGFPIARGGLSPWQMKRIHERVDGNLLRPDVKELADLCQISPRHLSRAFRATTGETISAFIDKAFFRHARTLLDNKKLSLDQVAQTLGYSSANSFSNAYKRISGCSPRERG